MTLCTIWVLGIHWKVNINCVGQNFCTIFLFCGSILTKLSRFSTPFQLQITPCWEQTHLCLCVFFCVVHLQIKCVPCRAFTCAPQRGPHAACGAVCACRRRADRVSWNLAKALQKKIPFSRNPLKPTRSAEGRDGACMKAFSADSGGCSRGSRAVFDSWNAAQ